MVIQISRKLNTLSLIITTAWLVFYFIFVCNKHEQQVMWTLFQFRKKKQTKKQQHNVEADLHLDPVRVIIVFGQVLR